VWLTIAVPYGAKGQGETARLAELAMSIQWARVDGGMPLELVSDVAGCWREAWLKRRAAASCRALAALTKARLVRIVRRYIWYGCRTQKMDAFISSDGYPT
jgi:hypothetical protein